MGYFADYMDDEYSAPHRVVPHYIDPDTGKYLAGTRKCSKCKEFKKRADFNKEQEKKPASCRICNKCGPPMPKDLNALTMPQIKVELLKKRGETEDALKKLNKAELVARLEKMLGINKKDEASAAASTRVTAAPLTMDSILSLKVVDLKNELKARGRPVSGLKAVLQKRLLEAEGLLVEELVVVPRQEAKNVDEKKMTIKEDVAPKKDKKDTTAIVVTLTSDSNKENASQSMPNVQQKHHQLQEQQKERATPNLHDSLSAFNRAYFGEKHVHWKKIPPAPGAVEMKENANGRTFHWCRKCRMWTPSHNTSQHGSTKETTMGPPPGTSLTCTSN